MRLLRKRTGFRAGNPAAPSAPSCRCHSKNACRPATALFIFPEKSFAAGRTHLLASAPRRCSRIARSRRLRKERGGEAAVANLKAKHWNKLNQNHKNLDASALHFAARGLEFFRAML
jgi:hypothetical protein